MDDNNGAKWSDRVDSAIKHSPVPPSLPMTSHSGSFPHEKQQQVPSHIVAEMSRKHAAGVSGQSRSTKPPKTARRQKSKATVYERALSLQAPHEGDEKVQAKGKSLSYGPEGSNARSVRVNLSRAEKAEIWFKKYMNERNATKKDIRKAYEHFARQANRYRDFRQLKEEDWTKAEKRLYDELVPKGILEYEAERIELGEWPKRDAPGEASRVRKLRKEAKDKDKPRSK
ncbi:hypothetical protein FA10DRAFT_287074 [Acaromyces ingoldii]|uniref:Uncharacterized protein n=1 Tax=Acaromyces ingoldii TaxID=215250 RepID=A0A316YM82_9BASI|nr:hypothetical protein FA10DRAFT_287074 [Acaromyces ingoldii]PWN89183.1 hypothetical protein FA10DRAFT_287074 [Acaromyces ingoldii]